MVDVTLKDFLLTCPKNHLELISLYWVIVCITYKNYSYNLRILMSDLLIPLKIAKSRNASDRLNHRLGKVNKKDGMIGNNQGTGSTPLLQTEKISESLR